MRLSRYEVKLCLWMPGTDLGAQRTLVVPDGWTPIGSVDRGFSHFLILRRRRWFWQSNEERKP